MRIACDIEGDGLLYDVTKVHCICCLDIDTDEQYNFGVDGMFGTEDLIRFPEWYLDNHVSDLIFHNGIGYDLPALRKVSGLDFTVEPDTFLGKPCHHWDTLLLSKLFNPDRLNGHSLEEWGKRLGNYKIDYNKDFTVFTKDMLDYCIQDSNVTKDIFFALLKEGGLDRDGYTELG